MQFSVWNLGKSMFDYYETADAPSATNTPKPDHLTSGGQIGVTVEQACWPLPAGAQYTGSGDVAIGRIAIQPGKQTGLSGTTDDLSLPKGILLAAAGALAIKFLLPRSRRR